MKEKKGFTLVELLAVIVVLAIILVIAVPKILDVIKSSRKNSIISSVKLVARNAEQKKLANEILGEGEDLDCSEIADLSSNDYESCTIEFDSNGNATVSIAGKGKFSGYTCSGTKNNVTCEESDETTPGEEPVALTDTIITLASNTANNIETHYFKNDFTEVQDGEDYDFMEYRYAGATVNNYVTFNNELWRIIGIVRTEDSNNQPASLLKIMRDARVSKEWDTSNNNDWTRPSSLNDYLNGNYLNGVTESNITALSEEAKSMVETNTKWGITKLSSSSVTTSTLYQQEQETTWKGTVALMSPSDYGYSAPKSCWQNTTLFNYGAGCKNSSWIFTGDESYQWFLTAKSLSNSGWALGYGGYIGVGNDVNLDIGVRPALYLKSNVLITGGNGSSENPYTLGM